MYWVFGILMSAALTYAVGRTLVAEHGRRLIPWLCLSALLLGLAIGYAINGYLAYVQASATMRFSTG